MAGWTEWLPKVWGEDGASEPKWKNAKEADRIRDELTAMGIQLKDAKDPAAKKK